MARGIVKGGLNDGGSNIKSIQRGIISFGTTETSKNITISSVNNANCAVIIYRYRAGTFTDAADCCIEGKLAGATTLNLSRTAHNNLTLEVAWQVIEFTNIKSLQYGESTNVNNTITAVVLAKSIVIISHKALMSANLGNVIVRGYLSSTTNLVLQSQSTCTFSWYVIEFN